MATRSVAALDNRAFRRSVAFVVPFSLAALGFWGVAWHANQDIELSLTEQRDADFAAFCAKYVANSGTDAHISCMRDLLELLKRQDDRRAESGLF